MSKTLKSLPKMVRISKFSKVIGYKINIKKKNQFHFYTITNYPKRKWRKQSQKASKQIKYLRLNLTKRWKTGSTWKLHRIFMTKMKDDTNKWKDICVNGPEKLILLKCIYFPKQSTDQMQSFWKSLWQIFAL